MSDSVGGPCTRQAIVAVRLDFPDEIGFRFGEHLEENKQAAHYLWVMKSNLQSLVPAASRAL